MEEEKLTKDEAKKKRERESSGGGGQILAPTLKTQSTQKKYIYFSKFSSIFQNPNFQFKFSFPNSQCPNFKLKS